MSIVWLSKKVSSLDSPHDHSFAVTRVNQNVNRTSSKSYITLLIELSFNSFDKVSYGDARAREY